MTGSASTLPQLFAWEAAKGMPSGAGGAVMDAAYDAAEEPATPEAELARFHHLCDQATRWSEIALRKVGRGLGLYADLLSQARGRGRDGAAMAEQAIRSALLILGDEPFSTAPDQAFIQSARKTLLETLHALRVASRVNDPRVERRTLRAGTAAASRAFINAWGFFGGGPAEARATVVAMRDPGATMSSFE
jgi:hypothetical protein